MAVYYGMNPPFFGGAQNILSRQEDERLIKNDILQLLLTIPGERVMRAEFGVNLRNIVFEQFDDRLISLDSEIRIALARYEPRIIVHDVILESDKDSHKLYVKIVGSLKIDPNRIITVETFVNGA